MHGSGKSPITGHVVIDEQNIIVARRCRSIKELKHRRFWAAHDSTMFAMQSVFALIKTICRKKIGRNHCLRIQNVRLWLMCVAQKPPRLSSLFTWSPHWDSREMNSNQLLWPNNKTVYLDYLSSLTCTHTEKRWNVSLEIIEMWSCYFWEWFLLVFVSFFPSSRENLNPLRYILAGGMFCLFT